MIYKYLKVWHEMILTPLFNTWGGLDWDISDSPRATGPGNPTFLLTASGCCPKGELHTRPMRGTLSRAAFIQERNGRLQFSHPSDLEGSLGPLLFQALCGKEAPRHSDKENRLSTHEETTL